MIIPAFNEEKRIGKVLEQLRKFKLPVVVVDDGSRDRTFEVAQKHKVKVLRHRVNLGKGAALKTGCETAIKSGAKAFVFMDADGQHRASDLPRFVKEISSGSYDIVFGSRNLNFGVPLDRFLGNKIASVIVNVLFGHYVSDLLCGLKALTLDAYRKISWESAGYGVEAEIAAKTAKLALRFCEIPVETVYYDRFKGVTFLDSINILFDVLRWKFLK